MRVKPVLHDPRRLLWLAGAAWAVWQALALLLGPAPDSYLKRQLDPYTLPYLRFFNLDNHWAFFAPNPGRGQLVSARYTWVDGRQTEVELTRALHRGHQAYLRYTSLFADLRENRPTYLQSAAHYLCRQYPQVRQVQFLLDWQTAPGADDIKVGKTPLDPEFLTRQALDPIDCPS